MTRLSHARIDRPGEIAHVAGRTLIGHHDEQVLLPHRRETDKLALSGPASAELSTMTRWMWRSGSSSAPIFSGTPAVGTSSSSYPAFSFKYRFRRTPSR